MLRVDLTTPLLLSRLLLPGMLDRGYGRIVNVSSLAGHVTFPYTETYAAAKDGLTASAAFCAATTAKPGDSHSLILGAVKDAGFSARTVAETGLTASTSFAAAEKVAAATLRAIDGGAAGIVVNPRPGRLLKALIDYSPGMGPMINRLSGADKLMAGSPSTGKPPGPADRRERSRTA